MRTTLLTCIALLTSAISAAEAPADSPPLQVFTFSDLITKAERIAIIELGPTENNRVSATVLESLKSPKSAPKKREIDPETLKRAEALLRGEEPPPAPAAPPKPVAGAEKLTLVVGLGKLPPPGTHVLVFLWDRAEDPTAYKLSHPQALYDVNLAPAVKNALEKPRSVGDGRYLRDWDRQLAEKQKERALEDTLRKNNSDEPVRGLQLRARRAILSGVGNGFAVSAVLENKLPRELFVYDGPAASFGVLLKPKGGEDHAKLILRAKSSDAGVDEQILNLADAADFPGLNPGQSRSHELAFDARQFPALGKLNGEYLLRVFYFSMRDGAGLNLESAPWTGALVSDEIPIRFGK